ncbi:DUF5615 family PIN-like protein [Stenotrophomonas sp. HMWF003]|uniref:PIN-like domain-containing protein n=1 Tax=Stenotrophomonas sp. HMWF003 TaxID=2056840 RepID=UPI000D4AFF7F|nr:DUF5615 family PIN-like protein [Stenotrophomonas sp. HMWF003]PTT65614.1 hypothetical protein DBR34_01945 [Stenotrophomonas sp. HMWF003]
MKAQIDENLPPALARAIDPIARVDDHEVVHVRDFVGSGTKDVALFEEAIQQGIQVHVTQDHHHRRPVEREAIARLGLTVFVLAKGWSTLNHYDCAARLLEWWPQMMQLAQLTQPGGMFRVPHLRASRGRLIPIKPTR